MPTDPREEIDDRQPDLRVVVPRPGTVSTIEALRGYGTIAAGYHAFVERELPKLKEHIDEARAASLQAAGNAAMALGEVRELRGELRGTNARVEEVRAQADSSADLSEAAAGMRAATEQLAGVLRETGLATGPQAAQGAMTAEQILLADARAKLAKAESEIDRIEREKQVKAERRRALRLDFVLSVAKQALGALLGAILVGSCAYAYGRVAGHEQGFLDAHRVHAPPPAASAAP